MKKAICFLLLSGIAIGAAVANSLTVQQMFLAYIENNNEIKSLVLNAEKAQLNYKSVEIDNGFDITVSTGTITLQSSGNGTRISAKPSATAKMSQFSNLSLSGSSNLNYQSEKDNELKFTDTSISLGVDIISPVMLQREISLKKAERSFLEAKRSLQNQTIKVETEFYNKIKSLLNDTNSLLQANKSLYEDTLSLESAIAKGYSERSSTYRMAQMKVLTDEHSIEEKKRNLLNEFSSFYNACGLDFEMDENQDLMDLIPSDIPSVTPVNILDYDQNKYTKIETALWNQEINSLSRKINNNYTLSVNGGYTFDNSSVNCDTVNAGVNSKLGGVNLNANLSVPVDNDSKKPSITMSASFTPNTFKKQKISDKQKELEIEQESISMENALLDYEKSVIDSQQNLKNLLWNQESYEESYKMYVELEKDIQLMYDQGIVNRSEYLNAKNNVQSYKIKILENQLNLIIYNNNVHTMFVAD